VADSGDPEHALVELLEEIGRAAQANQMGALFLIDEMQHLGASSLSAICMAFQAVSRAGLPVAMVGAGLPDLRLRLWTAKPYADGLFSYVSSTSSWRGCHRRPPGPPSSSRRCRFRGGRGPPGGGRGGRLPLLPPGVRPGAVELRRGPPIRVADLEAVRGIVQDTLAYSFFGTRLELATEAEQRYLSAMASMGGGPYPVARVAQVFGAKNQRFVSAHRDSLIDKGLIWSPRRGQVDFTVPLFNQFLAERYPI
jgi:hypothetical protein